MSEQLYKYLWRALCSKLLPSSFIQRIAFNIHLRKNAKKRVNCVWSRPAYAIWSTVARISVNFGFRHQLPVPAEHGPRTVGVVAGGRVQHATAILEKNCPTKDDNWHFLDSRSMLTDGGHCAMHYNSQVREGEPKNINNHL